MSEDRHKDQRERIDRLNRPDEPQGDSISPEQLRDHIAQWWRSQLTHWEKRQQEAERKRQQQDETLKQVLEENERLRETLRRSSVHWVTRDEWTQEVPDATAGRIQQMGNSVKGWFWKLAGIAVLSLSLLTIGLLVWVGHDDDRNNQPPPAASTPGKWTLGGNEQ